MPCIEHVQNLKVVDLNFPSVKVFIFFQQRAKFRVRSQIDEQYAMLPVVRYRIICTVFHTICAVFRILRKFENKFFFLRGLTEGTVTA
jgi:hypothetical protein